MLQKKKKQSGIFDFMGKHISSSSSSNMYIPISFLIRLYLHLLGKVRGVASVLFVTQRVTSAVLRLQMHLKNVYGWGLKTLCVIGTFVQFTAMGGKVLSSVVCN